MGADIMVVGADDLIAAGDHLIARRRGLATVDEIRTEAQQMRGHH